MPIVKPTLADVRVVVSDRAKVADDAMRLAHDGLVEGGYLEPLPSGRRFAPPYVNPGTRFVVAYAGDEAIGTATMVEDGPFGLPSDRAFVEEIDALRAQTSSLTEVSPLAISSRWRRHTRLVLGFVLGTVVRLNGLRGTGHRVLYAVVPRQAKFMSLILMGGTSYGPRPLMGAPATLIATEDVGSWVTFFGDPDGPKPRRLVAEYALDPDPTWLEVHEETGEWREEVLPPLLEESGLTARLTEKLEVLRTPTLQNGVRSSKPLTI